MKKFIFALLTCICLLPFVGCAKQVDYTKYVSERRTNIYFYQDDGIDVKVYCSEREQPYLSDGIKGEMTELCEVFVSFTKNPSKAEIKIEEYSGEMNYQAVENRYYLSFSAPQFEKSQLKIEVNADGQTTVYTALPAVYDGVLSCDDALKCVIDYKKELFDNMTNNGLFDGEIYVRLLYDDGCYYYVGVCGKDRVVNAFLVDGEKGKIIAQKTLNN